MFCSAWIGALQAGQQERGTTRLNGGGSAAAGLAAALAATWAATAPGGEAGGCGHCACPCCSSMIGSRWITTFRKLPTMRPTSSATAINAVGDCASRSSTRLADDGTELEDRQVHGDDQAADQHAQNRHDQRLEQARHAVDRGIDVVFIEASDFAGHGIE